MVQQPTRGVHKRVHGARGGFGILGRDHRQHRGWSNSPRAVFTSAFLAASRSSVARFGFLLGTPFGRPPVFGVPFGLGIVSIFRFYF